MTLWSRLIPSRGTPQRRRLALGLGADMTPDPLDDAGDQGATLAADPGCGCARCRRFPELRAQIMRRLD